MEHVVEQMTLLIEACDSFDAGAERYAKPIAAILRTLLHDTASSHALLAQIGALDQLPLLDTAGPISRTNILTISNLATMDEDGRYFARGGNYSPGAYVYDSAFGKHCDGNVGRTLRFKEWWTMQVIRDNKQNLFSRRDVVLGVAHQDGGSHVDPALEETYYRLSRSNSLAWQISGDGEAYRPTGSPVPASIRQIAHELLHSTPHGWHPGVAY